MQIDPLAAQNNSPTSAHGPYIGGVGTIPGGPPCVLCTETGTRRFWACPRGPRRPLFPPADSGDARGCPWGPLGAFPASWPLAPQPRPQWRLAASVGSQPGRRSRVRFVACMFPSSLFFLPFSFLLSLPLLSPSPSRWHGSGDITQGAALDHAATRPQVGI